AAFAAAAEPALHARSVPVWGREEGAVIAGPSAGELAALRAEGIAPLWSAADHGEAIHVLSHDRTFAPPAPPGAVRFEIDARTALYLLPPDARVALPRRKFHALFHGVPRVPLAPVQTHAADTAHAAHAAGTLAPRA